jgi:hypothetical protein
MIKPMSEHLDREVILLNEALELAPPERAAFLDAACTEDTALRQRVERLLQMHEQADRFLETPAAGSDLQKTVVVNTQPTEKAGDKIGHYKLLQQIGEGGCGVVYMAEQEEPVRRRLALKVIKLGMDTKQVIARFEAERQQHERFAEPVEAGRRFQVTEMDREARGEQRDKCAKTGGRCERKAGRYRQRDVHRTRSRPRVAAPRESGGTAPASCHSSISR